jgi:lambda family phage tail tape measure protein
MRAGQLIVDIATNLARLQQDMTQATSIVQRSMGDIERSINVAKSALAAFGVTFSAGFFASWVNSAFTAQTAMLRLAQSAGTTVEVMSQLKPVAQSSETSLDDVATSMQKLSKSMAEAGDGTTKAAKVFNTLKISTTDATGALRPAQDVMRELGQKLSLMRDQTLATAFAQEVLGKSGANMLPFLYELARAGEQQTKVTTEQAKAAKAFEDNLRSLSSASEQAKIAFANELLPWLTKVTDQMVAARLAAGDLSGALRIFFSATDKQNADPMGALTAAESEIAKIRGKYPDLSQADIDNAPTFSFGNTAKVERAAGARRLQQLEKDAGYFRRLAESQLAQAGRDPNSPFFEFAGGGIPTEVKNPLGESDALHKRFETTLQSLNKQYFDLTHSGSAATVMYETQEGTLRKLGDADKDQLLDVAKKIDAYKAVELRQKVAADYTENYTRAIEEGRKALQDSNDATRAQTDQLSFEIGLIGLSSREIDKANAVRAIELDLRQQLARLPRDDTGEILPGAEQAMASIIQGAEQRKRAITGLIKARTDAERDWLTGVKQGMNEYNDVVTNSAAMSKTLFTDAFQGAEESLLRFVKTGKTNLKDLVDTIETDLLRIEIRQQVTGPLASAAGPLFAGLGGLFGGASAPAYGSAGYAALGEGAGAGAAASFSWLPPVAAVGGLYLAKQSGLAQRARDNPITGPMMKIADPFNFLGSRGPDERTAPFRQGFGQVAANPYEGDRWFSGAEMGTTLASFKAQVAAQEQNVISNLHLSPDQIARVNAALGGISRTYSFGTEHTDWTQSGAAETIQADRLKAISDTLGVSIEDLTRVMSMSADDWQKAADDLRTAQASLEGRLGQMASALPGELGITSLEDARNALAVGAEGNSPLDRFSAARRLLQDSYSSAIGGDLSSVNAFPGVLQTALGVGRDVYASGPEFAQLFADGNRMLNDLLEKQHATQAEILKDVPATMLQTSKDQIAVLKQGFNDVSDQLKGVQAEIRRMDALQAA